MAEINDLSTTDASNTARFPENMAPSAVNNGARALEGLIARWHKDLNGSVLTTGAADAYVYSANQTLSAYYDGLVLGVDWHATNTGASTINVDALGAKSIKKNNDQDPAAGDLEAGMKSLIIYDGTNFQLLTPVANGPATQAEMEAATAVVQQVTPARQHFHPSAAKAWVTFDTAATIQKSYNITSITDNALGDWIINWATDFSDANYTVTNGLMVGTDAIERFFYIGARAVGTTRVMVVDGVDAGQALTETNVTSMHVAAFGDH